MLGGYYRFYPGDYLRDTSGLSLIEHGAYGLLLHHYYSTDGCLAGEKPRLYRLCGATTPEEQRAVDYILNMFFPVVKGRLVNKRADRELEARRKFIEEQARKGSLGGRPRKNPDESRGLAGAKAGEKPQGKPGESPPAPDPLPAPKPLPDPDPEPEDQHPLSSKIDDAPPYAEIIAFLNQKSGKNFNPSNKATRGHINARWKEGFRLIQFCMVIERKCAQWKGSPEWDKYLRPQTLFTGNFESYLNEREVKGNGSGNQGVHGTNTGAGNLKAPPGKYDNIGTTIDTRENPGTATPGGASKATAEGGTGGSTETIP